LIFLNANIVVNYVDAPLKVMLECMHTKYFVNTKRIAARITLKKYKEFA